MKCFLPLFPLLLLTSFIQAKEYRVTTPPDVLKLPIVYTKYVSASGYPVVAFDRVNDYALKEAAWLIDTMLAYRPDIRKAMIKSGSRFIVIPYDTFTTDIPEYAHLKPKEFVGCACAWVGRFSHGCRVFMWRRESACVPRGSLCSGMYFNSRICT